MAGQMPGSAPTFYFDAACPADMYPLHVSDSLNEYRFFVLSSAFQTTHCPSHRFLATTPAAIEGRSRLPLSCRRSRILRANREPYSHYLLPSRTIVISACQLPISCYAN